MASPDPTAATLQDHLDRLNRDQPADYDVPWTSSIFRHLCSESRVAKQTGKPTSTALALKERYVVSEIDEDLAIVYREGKCGACGAMARSRIGRIVRVSERPPLEGRVGRD